MTPKFPAFSNVPEVIRTPDLPLRRRSLYPAELLEHDRNGARFVGTCLRKFTFKNMLILECVKSWKWFCERTPPPPNGGPPPLSGAALLKINFRGTCPFPIKKVYAFTPYCSRYASIASRCSLPGMTSSRIPWMMSSMLTIEYTGTPYFS
mgnify:CR=1 FL=1